MYGARRRDYGIDDFLADHVHQKSNKLLKHLLKRGIRMQIYLHESEMCRFARRLDLARGPIFRKSINHMKNYDWAFTL